LSIKQFLKLLYPFALIYGFITLIRNKVFDWGVLKQTRFDIPIISIGNLSMGGTGKTPHIEYFISKYKEIFTLAVISRGYGRHTKGFLYVNALDSTKNVGDEPLQIKKKFQDVLVAVGEKRVDAIKRVMKDYPQVNMILLDDAFQHRYVKPGLNVLLTEYYDPFWKDLVVPAGRLREFRLGWKRADVILITKSPETKDLVIPPYLISTPLFYSKINYDNPVLVKGIFSHKILLVTGIANPAPLLDHLRVNTYEIIHHFYYPDHHNFSSSDIQDILSKSNQLENCMVLTTEKDWMRLNKEFELMELNIAYLPIKIEIENPPEDWLNFSKP